MSPRLALVLMAVVVVALCLWLFGVGEWLGDPATGPQHGGQGDAQLPPQGEGTDGAPVEGVAVAPNAGLVGQAAPEVDESEPEELVGSGALFGRILDAETKEPVDRAEVLMSGRSHEGSLLAARASSDASGRFHLARVPAGNAYSLRLRRQGAPERLIESVLVVADARRDLGDIRLGGSGALEGRVVDGDGQGIADAVVRMHRDATVAGDYLRHTAEPFATTDQDSRPDATARTDAEGGFRIERVEPGRVMLVVRAAGYGQIVTHVMVTNSGIAGGALALVLDRLPPLRGIVVDEAGRGIGRARVAAVAEGDHADLFVGRVFEPCALDGTFELRVPPAHHHVQLIAAADGYATAFRSISRDDEDVRVVLGGSAELLVRLAIEGGHTSPAGASVTAFFEVDSDASAYNQSHGLTDARGEVRLAAGPGLVAQVCVRHPTAGVGSYTAKGGRFLSDEALHGPDELILAQGSNTLDLLLVPSNGVVGHVRDGEGRPLGGARLVGVGFQMSGESTTSAADGSYELRSVGPNFAVAATLPGFVQRDPANLGFILFGWANVQDGTKPSVIDVEMEPETVLCGRVVDEAGRPIEGAEVILAGKRGSMGRLEEPPSETTTNAAGRYVLDGLGPGKRMVVLATCIDYVPATSAEIELLAGAVAEAPDIVLARGHTLRVQVLGPGGAPFAGASVQVHAKRTDGFREAYDALERITGGRLPPRTTNAAGRVELRTLPTGTATLTATARGTAGARYVLKMGPGEVLQELVLSLRASTSLEAHVVDAAGNGLAGVLVHVDGAEFLDLNGSDLDDAAKATIRTGPFDEWVLSRTTATDAEGRFRLDHLPVGSLRIRIAHEGHAPLVQQWSRRGRGGRIQLAARAEDDPSDGKILGEDWNENDPFFWRARSDVERTAFELRIAAMRTERLRLKRAQRLFEAAAEEEEKE